MGRNILNLLVSKWFFLMYLALGVCHFVAFPMRVGNTSFGQSLFVTLGLMTGSDPYTFKETIESHTLIWAIAWIMHVASWLLIPALVGLIINNAAEHIKTQQSLQIAMKDVLDEVGVPKGDLDAAANEIGKLIDDFKKESVK
jgi:hypothetical protein